MTRHDNSYGHVQKLTDILKDTKTYGMIVAWNQEGTSFKILDKERFNREVLPQYYKHSKYESFLRQMNLYGFKTVKRDSKMCTHEFMHPLFQRDKPEQIWKIRRTYPRTSCDESPVPAVSLSVAKPDTERGRREKRPIEIDQDLSEEPDQSERLSLLRPAKMRAIKRIKTVVPEPIVASPGYAFSFMSKANIEILYKCALYDLGEDYRIDLSEDFGI